MLDLGRFPYINETDGIFMLGDEIYEVGATTVLYNADDEIVAVGKSAVLGALTVDDEIEEVVVEDGVVKSIKATTLQGVEAAEALEDAKTALEDAITEAKALIEDNEEVDETVLDLLNDAIKTAEEFDVAEKTPAQINAITEALKDAIGDFEEAVANAEGAATEKAKLGAIKDAANKAVVYSALNDAGIDNVYSNVAEDYVGAFSEAENLEAVQGLVNYTNAQWAMEVEEEKSSWDSTNLVLTVTVNEDITPAALEIDHSQEGKLPEFWVHADVENPFGSEEDKAEFEEYGVKVYYLDGEWTIDFSGLVDEKGNDATLMLEGIEFHLKVVDVDGNEYGSMMDGSYLFTISK